MILMHKKACAVKLHRIAWSPERAFVGNTWWFTLLPFALLLVFLSGCATPIGTRAVGVRQTYEQVNLNAIKQDAYSDASALVLHRFFLDERFSEDPDGTVEILHDKACEDDRRDLLYALSELTYLIANKARIRANKASAGSGPDAVQRVKRFYLASAVYAYFYLLGERGGDLPGPYDRRFRVACDFYNTALSQALVLRKGGNTPQVGLQELPVGSLFLELHHDGFPYDLESFETVIPADELSVYGLTVRDRRPGLGAPVIAVGKKTADWPVVKSVPGTLFLRVEGDIRNLREGGRGRVELYSSYEKRAVAVNDQQVPLENDLSAQLAFTLNQPFLWDMGELQFLKGAVLKSGIYPVQPYSPGRIPVVFVHGTASSPVWWAEMLNTLRSDPVLWKKYQFWFYLYDSGKPIVLSMREFRESLFRMVESLDPEGKETAMKELVVVGHSQGGLLTKMTAVETGDAIIRAATQKGLDELDMDEADRAMVEGYLVCSPLPFVSRVVFISTPHRGSFLAGGWIRRIVKKIVALPVNVVKQTASLGLAANKIGMTGYGETSHLRTSIDGMSPDNPGLLALAEIPIAHGITGHSIIAIDGDEKPPDGDDGVVKYTSAHVDYVESEFIVRSGHSCQGHPLVIEEVRRILLEHLDRLARLQ